MSKTAKKQKKKNGQFSVALRQFKRNKLAVVGLIIFTVIALACIFSKWIAPHDYAAMDLGNTFGKITWEHICGTDQFGRDLFSRILKGGQISLVIAFASVLVAAFISMTLGASAAYFGGVYETCVMRLVDTLQSIPSLLLAAGISTALGPGLWKSVIALAISRIGHMTRIMYSSSLSTVGEEYLEAARACGASKTRMVFKYIIPNCIAPMIVQITMQLGTCITQIASLSFLGLGVKPPMPEWGSILNEGRDYILQYTPTVLFPGIAIALTLISVNLIGDGLRDALDPRLKR